MKFTKRLLTDLFSSTFWIILVDFRPQNWRAIYRCRYCPPILDAKIGSKEPKNRLKLILLIVYIYLIFMILFFSSCFSLRKKLNEYPPYKLMIQFSEKVRSETGLILRGYGVNCFLPRDYKKKDIGNFTLSFSLENKMNQEISLETARNLVVSLCESFVDFINSSLEIRDLIDVYPFNSELVHISVYFEDGNRIQLGQGIARLSLTRGEIEYEGYDILKYTGNYPAAGEHYVIHQESYDDALRIVKNQGDLRFF